MTWVLYALLSAIFASLVAIFGKIGIANLDSTLATTLRAIIMAAMLVLVSIFAGKVNHIDTIQGRTWLFIGLSGVAGALSWLAYFTALKMGPPAGVAALDRLSVVFVLVFSILFLSQKLTANSAIGAILLTIGAILLTK